MTGAEISAIIHQSAQSNVQEIDLPGLRLKFGEGGPAKDAPAPSITPETTARSEGALSEKQHEKLSYEQMETMEAEAKEERLSLMCIEDPSQYEELLVRGELKEGDDGDYGAVE